MACASAYEAASGFSHSTCFPAASSPVTMSRCRWFAVATLTASTSGAAATSAQSGSALVYP